MSCLRDQSPGVANGDRERTPPNTALPLLGNEIPEREGGCCILGERGDLYPIEGLSLLEEAGLTAGLEEAGLCARSEVAALLGLFIEL